LNEILSDFASLSFCFSSKKRQEQIDTTQVIEMIEYKKSLVMYFGYFAFAKSNPFK